MKKLGAGSSQRGKGISKTVGVSQSHRANTEGENPGEAENIDDRAEEEKDNGGGNEKSGPEDDIIVMVMIMMLIIAVT